MANEDLKQRVVELIGEEENDLERARLAEQIKELEKKKWIRNNPKKARMFGGLIR